MKRITVLITVVILFACLTLSCGAEDYFEKYKGFYDESGLEEFCRKFPEIDEIYKKLGIDPSSPSSYGELTVKNIFEFIADIFKNGLKKPIVAFISILAASMLTSVAESVSVGEKMKKPIEIISVAAASVFILPSVFGVILSSVKAVKTGAAFMAGFIPLFAGVVLASGKPLTSSLASGTMLVAAQITEQLCAYIVMPLTCVFLALGIAGCFGRKNVLSPSSAVKKAISFIMTASTVLFSGVLSVQSMIGTSSDSIGLRTAKLVAGSTPIIGGAVSEATGILGWCLSSLSKSAAVAGVIGCAAILLPILIELCVWRISVYFAKTSCEMFGCEKLSTVTDSSLQVLGILFSVILNSFVLFTVSFTIVCMTGGII